MEREKVRGNRPVLVLRFGKPTTIDVIGSFIKELEDLLLVRFLAGMADQGTTIRLTPVTGG
ncbi:MAG: hypothetical protein ACFFD4_09795 [Candidatus Odinarchaeota archaeon]